MTKTAVILTGYSSRPKIISQLPLANGLFKRGCEVVIIDPFHTKRSDWVFQHTMITSMTTEEIVYSVEKDIDCTFIKEADIAFFYSYGAIPGILQEEFEARQNVFLSPFIGKGTAKWSMFQKLLLKLAKASPNVLPALLDADSESLQKKLFEKMINMELRGENFFFIPKNRDNQFFDEKVCYPKNIINSLPGAIHLLKVKHHQDMINNPTIVNQILDTIKC
ncbi:MAG: hypothetical protein PHW52_01030 [Candidatus Pacebacteria bacterium]|nr:hypothetical protein [Candidatus Paceibacterota bacterium]